MMPMTGSGRVTCDEESVQQQGVGRREHSEHGPDNLILLPGHLDDAVELTL
jgi:hypothetical protein